MDSSSKKIEKETKHVKDDVSDSKEEDSTPSSKVNDKLSKIIPNNFTKMSSKKNLERLKILARKIERDDVTEKEMEEYGWRLLNQS